MSGDLHENLRGVLSKFDDGDLDLGQAMSESRLLVNEYYAEDEARCRSWVETLEAIQFRFDAKASREGKDRGFFGRRKFAQERAPLVTAMQQARHDLNDLARRQRRFERMRALGMPSHE